jgi:hypothetical protein
MTARKRTAGIAVAGALLAPLVGLAAPAHAGHIEERTIDLACPADQVSTDRFSDVPAGNTFARHINCLNDYGVAKGLNETTYGPAGFVLRRQMATFIYRIGLEAGVDWDTDDAGLKDLSGRVSGEQLDAINALANYEVAQGYTDGTYRPNAPVTRDQMASFIARFQFVVAFFNEDYEFGYDESDFFDDDDGNFHEEAIDLIASEGITIGRGGHRLYDPRGFVTRQQMAGFLARKLDILAEYDVVSSPYAE